MTNNDIKPPINPVEIYDRYLKLESDEKQIVRKTESKGRYSASGAGLCKRKQWYSYNDYPSKETDEESLRKMKLGTLIGEDFDKSMNWMYNNLMETGDIHFNPDLKILIEHPVQNDSLNLLGHFDLLVIKDRKGYLYDYKSCHEFTFRKATGKILSRTNEKDNYAYQLGTYAFMIEESDLIQCDEVVYMENIYINKNDSKIKPKKIDIEYKIFAKEYWQSIQRNQLSKEPPPFGLQRFTPTYEWECGNYCNYVKDCNSPYKKKDKK